MTRLEDLVQAAMCMDAESHESQLEFHVWLQSVSYEFVADASGHLDCFEVFQFKENEWHLRSTDPQCSPEVLAWANVAWRCCGGVADPEHARIAITTATVEFVRSYVKDALWIAWRTAVYQQHDPAGWQRWGTQLRTYSSLSPREMMAARYQPAFDWSFSRAELFYSWTCNFKDDHYIFQKHPPANAAKRTVERNEVFAGAVLVWLDAALQVQDPTHRFELLASAAMTMRDQGDHQGWIESDKARRQDSVLHGKLGAKTRFKKTNDLKQWALEQIPPQSARNMATARELAKHIPERLRDASTDPVRLIYDAIRSQIVRARK